MITHPLMKHRQGSTQAEPPPDYSRQCEYRDQGKDLCTEKTYATLENKQ